MLSNIKIIRVFRLNGDSQYMSSAPGVHCEYMHSVFVFTDEPFKFACDKSQLAVGQKTFVNGFLPAGAVSFEEITHAIEPPVIPDVVCYEIKSPVHENMINDKKTEVIKRNVSEMFWCGAIMRL